MKQPLLYPERQRCRKCRRYWCFSPPIRGLYCSPECAGRPPILMSEINGVLVPPRTCRRRLRMNGPNSVPKVVLKLVFATEAEAREYSAKNGGSRKAYECPNCWWWHLTKLDAPRDLRPEQAV